jgi:hypothetical protein
MTLRKAPEMSLILWYSVVVLQGDHWSGRPFPRGVTNLA